MTVEAASSESPAPVTPRGAFEAVVEGKQALEVGFGLTGAEQPADATASYERALQAFRQARTLAPQLTEAHVGMGQALLELGRFDQARSSFERALSFDAENADAQWGVARALLRLDQPSEALPRLERLTALVPAFAPAWLLLAGGLTESGDKLGALDVLRRAFEHNSQSPSVAYEYGRMLRDLGYAAESVEPLRRASELAEASDDAATSLDAKWQMGVALLEAGRPDDALEAFEAVANAAGALAGAARYGMGAAFLKLARYDDALDCFERLRQTEGPLAFYALAGQVDVLRYLGKYSQAWKLVAGTERAAEASRRTGQSFTDPDFAWTYGRMLRLLGARPEAIRTYQQALAAGVSSPSDAPEVLSLRYELIATYVEQGEECAPNERAESRARARWEFARAETLYKQALKDNRCVRNLIGLAALYALRRHDERARPLLLEAVERAEEDGVSDTDREETQAHLGKTHLDAGDYGRAASAFEAALAFDAENLNYELGAAEAYLRLGRVELAERRYRAILDVAPDTIEARIGLAEALTEQGDSDRPEKYEQASAEFGEAIRLGKSTSTRAAELREGSTALNGRKLATLSYSKGFALTKLYEVETARGSVRRDAARRLSAAAAAFRDALHADPSHPQAAQAIERIQRQKQQQRTRELFGTWVPLIVVGITLGLLVLVQLIFFVPQLRDGLSKGFRDDLQPTTYGMLVFGLLVVLIAAVSLPELRKLSVPGVALEKAGLEPQMPAQLGIAREVGLASIVSVTLGTHIKPEAPRPTRPTSDVSGAPDFDPPSGPDAGLKNAEQAATQASGPSTRTARER